MTEMSPLRRRTIEDMTVRNLSPATQRSYVPSHGHHARTRPAAIGRRGWSEPTGDASLLTEQ
jgi:hypothetical protein